MFERRDPTRDKQIRKIDLCSLSIALLTFLGLFVIPARVSAQDVPMPEYIECAVCGARAEIDEYGHVVRVISEHQSWCPYSPDRSGDKGGGYIPEPENVRPDPNEEFGRFLTDEAQANNSKGIEFYNKKQWSKALSYFKMAARYRPDVAQYKTNIENAAAQLERQKERERKDREWKKANEENLRRAKKAIAAIKKETARALQNLSCSAYWSLQSASAALTATDDVTTGLDDDWALARKFGQRSAEAMEGGSRSGCPEVKISIPDIPPPVEANPQVLLYNHIIKEIRELVPAIIKTKEEIRDVSRQLEKTNADLADTRTKKQGIEEQIVTTKSAEEKAVLIAEKKETEIKEDVLSGLATELLEEASDLKKKADEQSERDAELQDLYDDLRADPEHAQELVDREAKKVGVK